MDLLNVAGAVASLVGAAISLATLVVVSRMRTAIKRHSRRDHLTEIIDRVLRVPPTRETLADSTCVDVRFVLDTTRRDEFSRWFFLDRSAKALAETLEAELDGPQRRRVIQNILKLFRDELTV